MCAQPHRVVVLGAGLVGSRIAIDLAADPQFLVTAVDRDAHALARLSAADLGIDLVTADLSNAAEVRALAGRHELVVSAVPGFLGYATLKTVIEAGRSVVDIAFFPEDPFPLDDLAQQHGVVAIVDCWVAPGMSNILVGHVDEHLDETTRVAVHVGGLPVVRRWPFEYKAVFSPIDVIEEYTRPARYVENGRLVVRPALSDPELLEFPGIGTLESFNSDGLRTLARTIDCPDMKEKTLRYPGHIEKMAVLRETGFFGKDEIDVGGVRVRPIDVTAKLLFADWALEPGEADLTVMQVLVEGRVDGAPVRHTYDLLDTYDAATGAHSMARTTGYTATMALRAVVAGHYDRVGVSPPEYLGRSTSCVEFILAGLEERGVTYRLTVS